MFLCREPSLVSLIVRSTAKSFTAGSQRGLVAIVTKQKRDRDGESDESPGPADVEYESIDQFSSVVELYRGR